ncbi:MAG: hypothetical protein DRI54_02370 [Bacteroidetes bacterium]|nr:MAG: hypothetical protein DRI54_02370 [Bacteroidota bacterium]
MNLKLTIKEFILGISAYSSALSFIAKNKLSYFYLAPLLIAILFWITGFVGISYFSEWLNALFNDWFGVTVNETSFDFIRDYKDFISGTGKILITIILKILMLYLVFRLNKYITLILISPVLAYLSEKVEYILTGIEYPFNFWPFIKDVWRGILIAIRNMMIEFVIIIALWVLTFFIPILLPFTTVILIGVSAYFYGFSMIDYTNERKKINLSDSVKYIRKHKGYAIGNGLVYHVVTLIPFVGIVVAPITAAVAATLGVLKIDEKS